MKKINSLDEFYQYVQDLRKRGKLTMCKAIRLKCLDCSAYSPSEVEKCDDEFCPNWEFRTGRARRSRRQTLQSLNLMKQPIAGRGNPMFQKKPKSQAILTETQGDNLGKPIKIGVLGEGGEAKR